MKATGPRARIRRFLRGVHWRILACQVPLILCLLAGALYWLEGHVDRVLGDTQRRLGRESVALAASTVRHASASGIGPLMLDQAPGLPGGSALIRIVNLERRVVFSSGPEPDRTGFRFTDAPCVSCHVTASSRATTDTALIARPGQEASQVFAARVRNRPGCQTCHPPEVGLGMAYLSQPVGPAHGAVRLARITLLLTGLAALGFTVVSTQRLASRYLARPRLAPVGSPSAQGSPQPPPSGVAGSGGPDRAAGDVGETEERLRASLQQIERQRDELSTLYFITDQLSRSVQPNLVCRRAVELASSVFGSPCVLIAGHFHPDSRAFHGTVTYHDADGKIVERPHPDSEVGEAAPFYNPAVIDRWLRGELDGVVRRREGPTEAYPLERHGRRLGLMLAPVRRGEASMSGRSTPAPPEVVQVACKHLAIALEMSELQRERLHQERLAAIGQTVAGLSHCMKNTLSGLKGGQYIIERGVSLSDAGKLRKGLSVLTTAVLNLERLTHDMLFYAAERPLAFAPASPNDTLREIVELLEDSAREKGVQLRAELDPRLEAMPIDRNALYRAVLNLVTNAIDACVESDSGRLVTVRSRAEADAALLSVEDTGIGIPRELLRRLSERFFTTKGSQGTGLGLPVVHKIAELHGGTVEVQSVPGQGSTFTIRLPRTGTAAVS